MAEGDKCDEQEKNFHMVFYRMSEMVERMYGDYKKMMKKNVIYQIKNVCRIEIKC